MLGSISFSRWVMHSAVIALVVLTSALSSSASSDLVDVSLYSSAIIDAPIDQIWPIQSNFTHMNAWYPMFSSISIYGGDGKSVGSKRECTVAANPIKKIREELVAFDPLHHTYSYSVFPYANNSQNPLPFPMIDHRADVRLFPLNCDATTGASTFVLWSIRFKTNRSFAATAKTVNQQVFSVLFTQLAAYFKNIRKQIPTTELLTSVKGKSVSTSFGCAFTSDVSRTHRELTGKTSMALDFKPTEALLEVKPKTISNRRMYHFDTAWSAGYRFDIIEDTLTVSGETHSVNTTVDLSSASLPELRSIKSHLRQARVYPVVFQLPTGKNFSNLTTAYQSVLIIDDEFTVSTLTEKPTAIDFFQWLSNSIAYHIAAVTSTPADTASGKMVKRVFTNIFAIPSDLFWSAFDDYVEVQKMFSAHDNLVVDPNDPTLISFVMPGFDEPTVEKLTIKHNSPPVRIWQIIIPVPNPIFNQYTATVHFADSLNKNNRSVTHATLALEVQLRSNDTATREQFILMTEKFLTIRLQQIAAYVARHSGRQHRFTPFELDYNPAAFYKVVSSWADTTWVETSQGAHLNALGLSRFVNWPNGAMMRESMIDSSDEHQTLTYTVEPSDSLGCAMYAGDIKVEAIDGGKRTRVFYTSNILALSDLKPDDVVNNIVKTFTSRFEWLGRTFTGVAPDREL